MAVALTLGKLRRMASLADHDGLLQILSAHTRGGARSDLVAALHVADAELPPASVAAAEAAVAAALSTQASAVVLDPVGGLPLAVPALDRGAALVLPVDAPGGGLLEGWDVAKAVRAGAAAISLRVAWAPDGDEKTDQLVRMIGDEAAKHDVVFLLHVAAPAIETAADWAVDAAPHYSDEECQVDLLALELSADEDVLERVDEAAGVPWLVAGSDAGSGGEAGASALVTVMEAAAVCGASGFLGVSALWRQGLRHAAEPEAMAAWLATEGVHHFRRALVASERGRPWFDHPRYGGREALSVADAGEAWHRSY